MPKSSSSSDSATSKPVTTEINIFPFKTYGSLIKRELKWFESQSSQRINSILPLYKLAKKLAKDYEISEPEALTIVQNLGEDENKSYAFRYLEDLNEIQKNKYSESDFDGDIATMFIISRIPSSKLALISESLYEYYEIEFDAGKGWTSEYTEALPMSVIDDIVKFVSDERAGISSSSSSSSSSSEGSDDVVTLGK